VIQIENVQSKRIIRGRVQSANAAEVIF